MEVFLAHPGGPFWANKDQGAWTIPKGLVEEGEDLLTAAQREFFEETSVRLHGTFIDLGSVIQKSGKRVHAWACEADINPDAVVSNTCRVVWPPKSGDWIEVPEVDRCAWFDLPMARIKINPAQVTFLDRVQEKLLS